MRPTALFHLYQLGAGVVLPFAARSAVAKLRRAGVSTERAHERLGHATQPRPLGPLVWFHAASIGEAKSVLPLMGQLNNHTRLLLTSGTSTSATAIEKRLPDGAIHQYSPLDGAGPISRFLDHWRPDLCVLAESELWPNLLDICAKRDLPIALLNARLSEKSARRWQSFPHTANYLFRGIRMVHCQNESNRDQFWALGLTHATKGQNLKSFVQLPKLDSPIVDASRRALEGRPIWVAASTHASDEHIVLSAHKRLLTGHPSLCLILVPRHPDRADALRKRAHAMGMTVVQRSTGGALSDNAQVYLADTLDETDLWYTLSPIAFLGGSFSDVGGHTPYEPAAAWSAILHGPHYENFSDAYADFLTNDASIQITDDATLIDAVYTLLTHPSRAAQLAANASHLVHSESEVLQTLAGELLLLAGIEAASLHG